MDTDDIQAMIFVVIFAVCAAYIVFMIFNPLWSNDMITVNITEKIPTSKEYLVVGHFSNNTSEVFCVQDEPVFLKFDASDRYTNLKVGTKYSVRVSGYRLQVLSLYRNIYEIEGVVP